MKKLLLYSLQYGGSAAILKIVGFGVFIWLARSLTVDEFANFGVQYATQQALATFALAGIMESIIGSLKLAQNQDQQNRLFASATSAFTFMALASIVLSIMVTEVFFKKINANLISYISVFGSGVLLAWATLQSQLYRLQEVHGRALLFSFAPALGGIIGGFFAASIEKSAQSFFVGSALGIVITLIVFWTKGMGSFIENTRLGDTRSLLRGALPFLVVAFLGWLGGYGNNYLIRYLFSSIDVAQFTFALSICSIMLLIAGALNQVWSPRFYRLILVEKFEVVEKKNAAFFGALSIALGFTGGLVVAVWSGVIGLLGGNLLAYQSINFEIFLLFAAYVVLTPWWHCQNHFLVNAMGSSILNITLLTSIFGITTLFLLMYLLGPIGVYIGFVVQMLLRSFGIFIVARKFWNIRINLHSICCGLFLLIVGFILSDFGLPIWLMFFLYLIISGFVVYLFGFHKAYQWLGI